jgi:imidazole glycerol-phosphate synthase subunit HisH
MHKITIIDYGMGNLRSVQKALQRINVECKVTSDKAAILEADKLILPGVGHFKNGMTQMQKLGLIDVLQKKVIELKTPILGICLGMQLFTKFSEEGNCLGLGYINATTLRLVPKNPQMKIPHMGWNSVIFRKNGLFSDADFADQSFYFVHSYYVKCKNQLDILGTTYYDQPFTSAIQKENIIGVQFHPEKSFKIGLHMLKKFCS